MSRALYHYANGQKFLLEESTTHVGIRHDPENLSRIMGEAAVDFLRIYYPETQDWAIVQVDQIAPWHDLLRSAGLLYPVFSLGNSQLLPRPVVHLSEISESNALDLWLALRGNIDAPILLSSGSPIKAVPNTGI